VVGTARIFPLGSCVLWLLCSSSNSQLVSLIVGVVERKQWLLTACTASQSTAYAMSETILQSHDSSVK
jgi:hypothetical protein